MCELMAVSTDDALLSQFRFPSGESSISMTSFAVVIPSYDDKLLKHDGDNVSELNEQ